MNKSSINLSEEQIAFIRYMTNKADSNPSLKERMDKCIEGLYFDGNRENILESLRNEHRPNLTAEFLSLFGAPSGMKFLTHDFDPETDLNISNIIEQSLGLISKYKLPKSLYALINGFIKGPKWIDYDGKEHNTFLNSQTMREWCSKYPTLHPITSSEFGAEVWSFRNTVRLSKPDFPVRLNSLIKRNELLQGLNIKMNRLDKADFYTNVTYLFQIIKRVLLDIHKRDSSAQVSIYYDRSAWNEYRLHEFRIVHKGSEANPFDFVRDKLQSGGGDMSGLAKFCVGYCDWSIEANFEGEMRRWRILNFRNLPEIEEINENDIEGFSHIFTFYKYR